MCVCVANGRPDGHLWTLFIIAVAAWPLLMGRTSASLDSRHLIPALTTNHQCDDFFHKERTCSHGLARRTQIGLCIHSVLDAVVLGLVEATLWKKGMFLTLFRDKIHHGREDMAAGT